MKKIEYLIFISLFITSCNSYVTKKDELNSEEDTNYKKLERQIEKKFFYDSVIICINPTKDELDSSNYNSEYLQHEKVKFYKAIDFLQNNARKYLVYDSADIYYFLADKQVISFNKRDKGNTYKNPWLFILFNGQGKISISDSIITDYNKYFK